MTHMQQLAALGPAYFEIFSGETRTLLALSVREGVATYFSEVISGGSVHKNAARDYLMAHEQELWTEFSAVMHGGEMGDWLWSTPANPDQPQDIGYAIGARIVESYLDKAPDRRTAVGEILSVRDYPAFVTASGYMPGGAAD